MYSRLLTLTKHYSLFLFGARGVGKSTLVTKTYNIKADESCYLNLLDTAIEDRFARNPMELVELVDALSEQEKYVIIDEIQKVPKLLDVIHLLIESKACKKYFILTGSSARKLKISGVNLLAGRAFVYHLYPFSYLELGKQFNLQKALLHGMLPGIFHFKTNHDKQQFLQAYTLTYLKEEIWAEQLIKNLDPFRKFLEVAAQSDGKIINYANIARDVGADDKTVKNYFSILEDTLLGFILEPFQHSFRKRLKSAPKFYFFDVGVTRALARMLSVLPKPGTSYYGELFESFVIVEIFKLATYYQPEYKFSYFMTGAGVEIDLIVERPNQPLLLIEIKSSSEVHADDLRNLRQISTELGPCEAICLSNEARKKKMGGVIIYPWQEGIAHYFQQ